MKNLQDKQKPGGFINTVLAFKGDAYGKFTPSREKWIATNGKAMKNMRHNYKEDT